MSENVFWVNSTKFWSYSCRNGSIPVESSGIQAIPVPFQCIPVLFRWNPVESGRMDAFLQESLGHQKVQAGPMGVCQGMALCEGCLPHQHHHTNTDNISRRQRCLPPDTPPPPMSTPQDTHPCVMCVCCW